MRRKHSVLFRKPGQAILFHTQYLYLMWNFLAWMYPNSSTSKLIVFLLHFSNPNIAKMFQASSLEILVTSYRNLMHERVHAPWCQPKHVYFVNQEDTSRWWAQSRIIEAEHQSRHSKMKKFHIEISSLLPYMYPNILYFLLVILASPLRCY